MPSHPCGPQGGRTGKDPGFRTENWCWKLNGVHRAKLSKAKEQRDKARAESNEKDQKRAARNDKRFQKSQLYRDIAETLDTSDMETITSFRDAMREQQKVMADEATGYNEAYDEVVDQFGANTDVSGRKNRGAYASQLKSASDPSKVKGFDEAVQYVRDHSEIAAHLASGIEGESVSAKDVESLVFEALKQGKKEVPGLNSDAVWDRMLEMLESFGGPVEQYERQSAVEFSMKFWKEVIRPETYVHKGENGKRVRTTVTKDRIKHWDAQAKKMLDSGRQIPVPYFHTDAAKPILKDKIPDDPRDTAAYIVDRKVENDGALWMLFDPVSEDAEAKVNNQLRHVSIRTDNFVDSDGTHYNDAITHVAATNNGVMKDQKPFIPEHGLALSLSMCMDDGKPGNQSSGGAGGPSLALAIELLANLDIVLPEDTNGENFLDRLCTAAKAVQSYKDQEEGEDDYETRPEGSKTQRPAPIAMSNSLLQFSLETIERTPKDPAGNDWTEKTLKAAYDAHKAAQPKLEFSAAQQAALDNLQEVSKQGLVSEFEECIEQGTMTPDAANGWVEKLNDISLTFSLDGTVDEEDTAYKGMFDALRLAQANRPGAALHGEKNITTNKKLKFSLRKRPESFDSDPSEKTDDQRREDARKRLKKMGYAQTAS